MRNFGSLILVMLLCGSAVAGTASRRAQPSAAASADAATLKDLGKPDDLPPLLAGPAAPMPDRPAVLPQPGPKGTAGRSLDVGEIRITPGGFVGVDLQRTGR